MAAICDHLSRLKFSPNLPHAFTEHGAIMAAGAVHLDSEFTITTDCTVSPRKGRGSRGSGSCSTRWR